MVSSVVTFPLRLGVRTAQAALQATRSAAEAGLDLLEIVGDVLERTGREVAEDDVLVDEPAAPVAVPVDEPPPPKPPPPPTSIYDAAPEPEVPHVDSEAELVEEIAEPGAEDGAGATIRVDPPFEGYEALRAADVIARLTGADVAELGAIELYEQSHRARRTVLDAIAKELRRPR